MNVQEQIAAQKRAAIKSIVDNTEELPYSVVVARSEPRETKGGKMLVLILSMGGSRTIKVNNKEVVDLNEAFEKNTTTTVFENEPLYGRLISMLDEKNYTPVTRKDEAGNDIIDAQLNAQFRCKIVTFSTDEYVLLQSDGTPLLKTRGADAGKPATSKKLTIVFHGNHDPLEAYERAYSRIKSWVNGEEPIAPAETATVIP